MAILATLREYKDYNSIKSPNKDEQIELLLKASSTYIKNYCNRTFTDYFVDSKTESFNGNASEVFLSEFPLVEVTSVKTSVDGGVTQETLVENTDYFVDKEYGRVISVTDNFVNSTITYRSLEIVYTGGFVIAPSDLVLATIELAEYYKNEEHIKTRSMSGASVENVISKSVPQHIKMILDSYRSA